MDLLTTFVLPTASKVLSDIIINLVTGKTKAALKAEIEQEVTHKVFAKFRQSDQKPQDLEQIVRKVVDEVRLLAQADPDLKALPEKIELEKPIKKPFLPFQDRDIQKEVDSRLERLNKIIAQRRQELGLPPEADEDKPPEHSFPQKVDDQTAPSGWKRVEKQGVEEQHPYIQQDKDSDTQPGDVNSLNGWQQVDKQEVKNLWQKRIEKTIRDIEIIRSGGDVTDE